MDKPVLNLDALVVDTFVASSMSDSALIGQDQGCTGCDSGCGIVWP